MKVLAFDSGVGGLSAVLPFLREPGMDLTYFGDLAHLPYGTKSPRRVRELTERAVRWQLERAEKAQEKPYELIVVACNTASAHALDMVQSLGAARKIPVVGVLQPSCRAALRHNSPRVVVLATHSTVSSGAYSAQLRQLGAQQDVLEKACPLFVPLVEDLLTEGPAVDWIIDHYLGTLLQSGDTAILGCTHYPYLLGALRKRFPNVNFVDVANSLLAEVSDMRAKQMLPAPGEGSSSLRMFFSDQTTSRERLQQYLQLLGFAGLPFELDFVTLT